MPGCQPIITGPITRLNSEFARGQMSSTKKVGDQERGVLGTYLLKLIKREITRKMHRRNHKRLKIKTVNSFSNLSYGQCLSYYQMIQLDRGYSAWRKGIKQILKK